jgi:hypothetical protein
VRKTKKTVAIVISVILLIALGLYIAGDIYYHEAARMYERNWHIVLPNDLKKQYDISSFGALGDGSSYTIYGLKKDEYAPFLEGTSSQKNTTMQSDVIEILNSLKADKQKYPDFSHNYKWKILSMDSDNRDKLYIVYDMESSFVYFVQDFY